jgi:hypothetical protein
MHQYRVEVHFSIHSPETSAPQYDYRMSHVTNGSCPTIGLTVVSHPLLQATARRPLFPDALYFDLSLALYAIAPSGEARNFQSHDIRFRAPLRGFSSGDNTSRTFGMIYLPAFLPGIAPSRRHRPDQIRHSCVIFIFFDFLGR